MSWLKQNLLAIDQWGNALAGGYAINTVSARTGCLAAQASHRQATHLRVRSQDRYWLAIEALIDWGFEPLDGVGHCQQAYTIQRGALTNEEFRKGSDIARGFLAIAAVIVCVPLGLALRAFGVKPEGSRRAG